MEKCGLHVVASEKMAEVSEKLREDHSLHIVTLNGNNIQCVQDFLWAMAKGFKFPPSSRLSPDGYLDWIRDLSWLKKSGYVLIIEHYSELMKDSSLKDDKKDYTVDLFKRVIFPFWEEEVTTVICGGSVKPFNVFLVD